ncbi:MAG: DUF2975 domain-containing protein [Novosphingobium sp.]
MARRDPLLAAARVLLIVAMCVTLAGAVTGAVTMPVVLGAPARVLAWIAEHGQGTVPPPSTPTAIATLLGLLVVMALISFAAQRLLLGLIDSVGEGDPFNPHNARRLARMGWLTLAIQILGVPASALAGWIEYFSGFSRSYFGFSLTGVLLALVLFILARVFRQGAAMREELEGTV